MKALEIKDLYKNYGDISVLNGLTLKIDQGDMYALMGVNGSGKSTLLSIVACTNTLTSGIVNILGYNTIKDSEEAKKLIGYVPQEKFSSPYMTGEENLLYFIRMSGIPKKEAKMLTKELLKKMDLKKFAKRRVAHYSGGMRKKLELATALLPDVKLLLLDEPTTGLDPSTRKKLLSKLKNIQKDGVTIFYVTHIGEDAESASKVGFIDKGTLITEGRPIDLKENHDLGQRIIEVEPTIMNEQVFLELSNISPNSVLLETESSYKIYCEKPRDFINIMIKRLNNISCDIKRLETRTPSLEEVFFKITERKIEGC